MSGVSIRQGAKVFVTGATGYVGSVIAETLHDAGYQVRALTRSEGTMDALARRGYEPVLADIRDAKAIAKAATGVEAIIHTATPNAPSPGKSMEEVVADAVKALEGISDSAVKNKARLIIMSGTSIYGSTNGKTVNETAPVQVPSFLTPYTDVERRLTKEPNVHIIRSGVVYGRLHSAALRETIQRVRARRNLPIIDPNYRLAVVHVDDLAALFRLVLEAETPPSLLNGVSAVVAWPDIMRAIGTGAERKTTFETITPEEAMALGGIAIYLGIDMAVSGALARSALGWKPDGPSITSAL